MADDSRTFEMRSGGIVDQNREENELMLELSIGGIFGKSEETERNVDKSVQKDDREEDLNVQSKREVQALRRRELRRMREEKPKKLVGFGSCGSVSGPIVENKELLEKQIIGQHDDALEMQPARKKERIGNLHENVVSDSMVPITHAFANQKVTPVCGGGQVDARIDEDLNTKNYVYLPTACRNFRPYEANMNLKPVEDEIEGGGRRNCKVSSNGSAGYASSAFSDSQCSPHQGGVTDDSRSNSSNSQLEQQLPSTSAASDPSDQPTASPKRTISTTKSAVFDSCPMKPINHQFMKPPPESSVPSKLDTGNQHQPASFLARMPCVSTTGNGPNGKTISGFLYRYTKSDVSIVCVCHGQSFSPAGFVEHAGGVGIVYPLKHITILPTAFAS